MANHIVGPFKKEIPLSNFEKPYTTPWETRQRLLQPKRLLGRRTKTARLTVKQLISTL